MSTGLKLEQQDGDIPLEWELVAIREVCTLGGGKTPSKSNEAYWDGSLPWVSPKDFDGVTLEETEDNLTQQGVAESSINLYQTGDIAMVVRSGVLRHSLPVAQLEAEMAVNQDIKVLQPDTTKIASDYLLNILLYEADRIRASCVKTGTTVESVETAFLKSYKLPLPPLPEQRRIADILSTVDEQIQQTEEIKLLLEETQAGLVQDYLTFGMGDSEIVETDTPLGPQPQHWEVTTIEDIVSDEENAFTDGARYALSSAEIHEQGEVRAILLEEVGEGTFNDSNPKFATQEKYEEIPHRAIYPGEVVVAKMASPVARSCIVPDTYDKYLLGCADVVRIATNEEYDPYFLMYCMNSHKLWRQAVSQLRGTGRSRINLENVAELLLPKPPLDEQLKITETLQTVGEQIERENKYHENLKELKRGLMQDLLTGKVRVDTA